MQYFNFDVEIGPGDGREYSIVVRSQVGDTRGMMRFPFDELALKDTLKDLQIALLRASGLHRQVLVPEAQTVQAFGQQLFDALIAGEVRVLYDVSRREADQQGMGVRLRVCVLVPELAVLPWEYLYDARVGEFICLSRNTPLVRYLEVARPIKPLKLKPPLRILGMIASPSNFDSLDIQRERRRMQEALHGLERAELVKITWLEGQTWRDLQRAMLQGPWHIFHFIGHGGFDPRADEGMLALTDDQGRAHLLRATQVGNLLADHPSMRLVLLNACEGARGGERDLFSSTSATLARRGIPAVLAMQYEITDQAAIEFTRAFYEALAGGFPVDEAVSVARKSIDLGIANTLEWGTPVLYMRAPDGVLFDLPERLPPPQPQKDDLPTEQPSLQPGLTRRQLIAVVVGGAIGSVGLNVAGDIWLTATSHGQTVSHFPTPTPISYGKFPLGKLLYTYRGHADKVNGVRWSPDGKRIASGGFDQTVQVWGATDGSHVFTYRGHSGVVGPVAWSPDGKRIASGGTDNTVQVWDATDGGNVFTYRGHSALVIRIAWSPDGSRIASGSFDGTVQVWNATDGGNVYTYRGHSANIVEGMDWSPNGKRIASSGGNPDFTVQLWDALDGGNVLTQKFSAIMRVVKWSHKSQHIAVGNYWDGIVYVLTDGDNNIFIRQGHTAGVLDVAWSPDDRRIASGSSDQTVQVWNAVDGGNGFTYYGHSAEVGGVDWSPDGSLIASGSFDKTVQVWGAG